MGLFSSSKSSSNTTNNDNRSFVDYGNAILDSSQDSSVNGFGNNNSGSINITDGGAIQAMGEVTQGVARETSKLMTSMFDGAVDTINDANYNMGSVARAGMDNAVDMLDITSDVLDRSGERNLAAALDINQTTTDQLAMGYDLNRDLNNSSYDLLNNTLDFADSQTDNALGFADAQSDAAMDFAETANKDSIDGLNTGFKSMMQFADSFSRSDGNDFAETQMKTIGLIVAGVAVIGVAAIVLRKGR